MQAMLRGLGLTLLLTASAASALAMDQSAMEETNCLTACDANSENCIDGGLGPQTLLICQGMFRETGPSLSLRRTTKFSHVGQGMTSDAKERAR